jgi:hypothetical protein
MPPSPAATAGTAVQRLQRLQRRELSFADSGAIATAGYPRGAAVGTRARLHAFLLSPFPLSPFLLSPFPLSPLRLATRGDTAAVGMRARACMLSTTASGGATKFSRASTSCAAGGTCGAQRANASTASAETRPLGVHPSDADRHTKTRLLLCGMRSARNSDRDRSRRPDVARTTRAGECKGDGDGGFCVGLAAARTMW